MHMHVYECVCVCMCIRAFTCENVFVSAHVSLCVVVLVSAQGCVWVFVEWDGGSGGAGG